MVRQLVVKAVSARWHLRRRLVLVRLQTRRELLRVRLVQAGTQGLRNQRSMVRPVQWPLVRMLQVEILVLRMLLRVLEALRVHKDLMQQVGMLRRMLYRASR